MNKKLLALSLVFVMIIGVMPNLANAESEMKIWVEGEYISMDVEPYMEDGRTLVPLRFITEALGYKVEWDGEERVVTLMKDDDQIIMTIG